LVAWFVPAGVLAFWTCFLDGMIPFYTTDRRIGHIRLPGKGAKKSQGMIGEKASASYLSNLVNIDRAALAPVFSWRRGVHGGWTIVSVSDNVIALRAALCAGAKRTDAFLRAAAGMAAPAALSLSRCALSPCAAAAHRHLYRASAAAAALLRAMAPLTRILGWNVHSARSQRARAPRVNRAKK